jgi:hypothetical protein
MAERLCFLMKPSPGIDSTAPLAASRNDANPKKRDSCGGHRVCEIIQRRSFILVRLRLIHGITLQHRTDMGDDVLSRERNDRRDLQDVAA